MYIVTPTYNRKNELAKLYASLRKQSLKDFTWLIIDDGSTDDTEKAVNEMMASNPDIHIEYYKKTNGGKHTAYNLALEVMDKHSYHVVVDSDDWLTPDAIEIFERSIKTIKNNNAVCGCIFPKGERDDRFHQEQLSNVMDLRMKYGVVETCILLKNSIVGSYQFPVFEHERFMSEEVFYIDLDKKGKFQLVNEEVYYFDYLEGGLTNNIFQIWMKNPQGTLYFLNKRKEYIVTNYKGLLKFKEWLKVYLNIESFRLAIATPLAYFKETSLENKLLFPFIYAFKKMRFK